MTVESFDDKAGAIESTITVNEMMGSELHLHVATQNEQNVILRLPTVDLTQEQRQSISAGNKLAFTFASKVVQLFDPETEQSLLYK